MLKTYAYLPLLQICLIVPHSPSFDVSAQVGEVLQNYKMKPAGPLHRPGLWSRVRGGSNPLAAQVPSPLSLGEPGLHPVITATTVRCPFPEHMCHMHATHATLIMD